MQKQAPKQVYHQMTWKPDVTLMTREELKNWMGAQVQDKQEQKAFFEQLTLLLLLTISTMLKDLGPLNEKPLEGHYRKYVSWMKRTLHLFRHGELPGSKLEWNSLLDDRVLMEDLRSSVSVFSGQGKLFVECSKKAMAVILGDLSMQEVLFEDDLATNMYREIYRTPNLDYGLTKYLDALVHKHSNMSILEIGAGTGAGTKFITDILSRSGETAIRCSRYHFTDISPYFFERARAQFARFGDRMNFGLFDIEREAKEQGPTDKYDVVIAFGSVHVTTNLLRTLKNIRTVLRPGGKFIICDPTRPDILRTSFATGLLADWWLSEEPYREWTPVVSKSKWNDLLLESGFSGLDAVIDDYMDEACQEISIMITIAMEPDIDFICPETTIVTGHVSPLAQRLVETLKAGLESIGCKAIEILPIEAIENETQPSERVYISLLDYDEPVLHELDADLFSLLKALFLSHKSVLWVTGGGGAQDSPYFGVVDGLFRVLRNENIGSNFITLELEKDSAVIRHADHIFKIVEEMFRRQDESKTLEYAERDRVVCVNRLEKLEGLDEDIGRQRLPNPVLTHPFGQCPPIRLELGRLGLLDTLRFVETELFFTELMADEVEVKVMAVGMTILDVMAAMGRTKTANLGRECSGVVTKAGPQSNLQPGDRVSFIADYAFQSKARSRCAVKILDDMSFEEAAAIPLAFTMAYYALNEMARAQAGETVLVHGGGCATGSACIQFADLLELDLFVTTEAADLVVQNYHLPEDRIRPGTTVAFVKHFERLLNGKGIDIVLNTLDEDGTAATWDLVAPFGRFIEVGPDFKSDERRLRLPESSNLLYSTTDIFELAAKRPERAQKILAAVMKLFRSTLKLPKPFVVYPLRSVEEAFRNFSDLGKTIITVSGSDIVKVATKKQPQLLDEDVTYLISGGLGSCGREIASWMVKRGARHLLLLSRSGTSSESASAFVASLQSQGAQVLAPVRDVCDLDALHAVLDTAKKSMPPIKGCVQCSMVVENRIFPKMTHEEWVKVTDPKIRGSWNLHTALPPRLSFFVLLSSMSGCIGFPSQAHYAAGNTFQDRLARYRRSQGQRGVALCLGPIDIAGQAYRTEAFVDLVYNSGFHLKQSGEDLCAVVEYTIAQEMNQAEGLDISQMVMGIEDPLVIRSTGKEEPNWMRGALFSHFYTRGVKSQVSSTQKDAGQTDQENLPQLLRSSVGDAEASSLVTKALVKELSGMLLIKEDELDPKKPMNAYGVDSLVAIDVRTWFSTKVGADISVFDIMGGASMEEIAGMATKKSSYRS